MGVSVKRAMTKGYINLLSEILLVFKNDINTLQNPFLETMLPSSNLLKKLLIEIYEKCGMELED